VTPRPLSPGAGRSRAVSQGASCHVPRPGGIQGPCKGQDRGRGVVQDAHACRPRERAHVNPTPRKTEPHFTKRCVFQKPIPYIPHLKAILSFEGAASRVWSRLSMSVSFLFPDHARLKLRRPNPPKKTASRRASSTTAPSSSRARRVPRPAASSASTTTCTCAPTSAPATRCPLAPRPVPPVQIGRACLPRPVRIGRDSTPTSAPAPVLGAERPASGRQARRLGRALGRRGRGAHARAL
jgi:hypothetical protein